MRRHYGMDWLRIGAFALLILYHIGMVFVPWNFHVKADPVVRWATLPMLIVNAWRLSLLFVVSGYASRALLARSSGTGAFVRNRSYRLLVPLAFGVVVIVPPQTWVELVTKYGYAAGYPHFWIADYFGFRLIAGLAVPTWNHLWFVGYLWIYTMLLAGVLALVRLRRAQQAFDRAFGGIGGLLLPMAYLIAVHAWWLPMKGETHTLIDDTIAHASYLPAFLFGFGLARSEAAMRGIARFWPLAAALAVLGYCFIGIAEVGGWIGRLRVDQYIPLYGAAHAVQQWGGVVALIGIADRWFDRDRPLRATLTEAVFPFYLVHQTIIVLVMYWLIPARLAEGWEFAILVVATVAGCWAFYLGGRRIAWLRPLIGLRAQPRPAAPPIV